MRDFANLPSTPAVGGLTDAETLAWFRARPKHKNGQTIRTREKMWASIDAGTATDVSSDSLFWLFKVSLGARKQQAWKLQQAALEAERILQAIEYAPASGPVAADLVGLWTPGGWYVCAPCVGRITARGCGPALGGSKVEHVWTGGVRGVCLCCEVKRV